MNPDPFTLRELIWMIEARGRERWNHTADLMMLIANCHRAADSEPFRRESFHPYTEHDRESEIDDEVDFVGSLSMVKGMFSGD